MALLWGACADEHFRNQASDDCVIGGLREMTPHAKRILMAVADRYGAFMAPLRDGSVMAHGHLADGRLVELSAGIWSRPHIWIDFCLGDVGEFEDPDDETGTPPFVAKWLGIELLGNRLAMGSREKTALNRVQMAAEALWPDRKSIAGVSWKEREKKIGDWLQSNRKPPVSLATIKRFLAMPEASEPER